MAESVPCDQTRSSSTTFCMWQLYSRLCLLLMCCCPASNLTNVTHLKPLILPGLQLQRNSVWGNCQIPIEYTLPYRNPVSANAKRKSETMIRM